MFTGKQMLLAIAIETGVQSVSHCRALGPAFRAIAGEDNMTPAALRRKSAKKMVATAREIWASLSGMIWQPDFTEKLLRTRRNNRVNCNGPGATERSTKEPQMKTAMQYLEEANAVVTRIPSVEAVAIHKKGGGVFVDVRDSADIAKSGTVAGAQRIPRGFIEFAADDSLPYHNAALKKDADIYLICGLGGQAALAGQRLKEMGFNSVTNIGGFNDWKTAGGPVE